MLQAIKGERRPADLWRSAVALAGHSLDFVQTNAIDAAVQQGFRHAPPIEFAHRSLKLAILGTSTCSHLHAGIRLGGLRRGIWIETLETAYGQIQQELLSDTSDLHTFKPDFVLFAFDAHYLTRGLLDGNRGHAEVVSDAKDMLRKCWSAARERLKCPVIQQTILPTLPDLAGNNEVRFAGSPSRIVGELNAWLRSAAADGHIDLLAIDTYSASTGVQAWHDPALWCHSKQEVTPKCAPVYGDLVGRLVAARLGRSYKALVLDLDNTLWGGVVGDDGWEGVAIGHGSAVGEAFAGFQRYVRGLSQRGVILAVCSKNDPDVARTPFERRADMVLRMTDFAAFSASWDDKASGLRRIASELNIGTDSIVFADDSPFERELIRRELREIAVPELGDDPSNYPQLLSDAGYFETVNVTTEDRQRAQLYRAERQRESMRTSATDLPSYLRSLEMVLSWKRFDQGDLKRIVQLINKTNQFNLRTRRYSEEQVASIMEDPGWVGLHFRLVDRLSDNGIVGIIIGELKADNLFIDTWLMSCRVLGRQVEQAMLNVVVGEAASLGARRLLGEYLPTQKNGMVRDFYRRLGFITSEADEHGVIGAEFELKNFVEIGTSITIEAN